MAPLAVLLTALDLVRAVGVAGLGLVRGLDLVLVLDRDLDRIQDLGLVPAVVRVPITGLVSDRRAAPLALLRRATIRLSTESSATVLILQKAIVGLRPSFSSHVRLCERGAPSCFL
jgi:hypothetical protein